MGRATSAEDYKLISSFESVRAKLLQDRYADRLSKPLAYWALPNDRRLPLAFLGRSVRELLDTPFDELTATPGIGQKKIHSMVKLLHRATRDEPPAVPFGVGEFPVANRRGNGSKFVIEGQSNFDPAVVSEALWSQWCNSVRKHDLGAEKLGRLAPTLRTLPTVIWDKPLNDYLGHTVAEIRNLRTHGEKRVRCVLEVFHAVNQRISDLEDTTDISIRLMPRFVPPMESWISDVMSRDDLPSADEIRDRMALPLLEQIKADCGETVYQVARQRLGIDCRSLSVRTQAQDMGVTRARVYQLLDDCSKVMRVRWPDGKDLLDNLATKFQQSQTTAAKDLSLFYAAKELCFPDRHHDDLPRSEGLATAAESETSEQEETAAMIHSGGDPATSGSPPQ